MALPLFFDLAPHRSSGDKAEFRRRARQDHLTTVPNHADLELLAALQSGDVIAFESLYLTHAAAVHEFTQAYVSADVADDIVQDVFIGVWNRRTSLIVRGSIRAYLFGAARLRSLQYRRNAQTRDTLLAQAHAKNDTPIDAAESSEVRAAVAHALMTLPGRTRELLALRWVYGVSYVEAATILGVSTEAAKKLGRRAERALAPLLERFRP